jgi:hypothetical protein
LSRSLKTSSREKRQHSLLLKALGILFAQVILIAILDEVHIFMPNYNFIGTSFVIALLFLAALQSLKDELSRVLLVIFPLLHLCELFIYPSSPVFAAWNSGEKTKKLQCRDLVERNPQFPWRKGIVFRSEESPYPDLDLCCGERTGSQVPPYGLYHPESPFPENCKKVDSSKGFQIVSCSQ